ncbi:hypothetical protein P171DRAFT_504213 [Karstenula rhodostoma CBS 690.94]|uniref:Uncharacterized protein n=1 Tax=Karstenula rhodostoma CBS 690.94 TaxID=1392251 RepID=A0A9P4P762_9PLEO|nr:hypothetical protein P171DRAFT_504213 [Karstenula rhodostoma CBS 690.94]
MHWKAKGFEWVQNEDFRTEGVFGDVMIDVELRNLDRLVIVRKLSQHRHDNYGDSAPAPLVVRRGEGAVRGTRKAAAPSATKTPVTNVPAKQNPQEGPRVGDLVARLQRRLSEIQAMDKDIAPSFPPFDANSSKLSFGNAFNMLRVSAIPAGRMKPNPRNPEEPVPVVYATIDRTRTLHFVKSDKRNVPWSQVILYHPLQTIVEACRIWKREAQALARCHLDNNPVASYPEIELATQDPRKVPILLALLYGHGKLGGRTKQQEEEYRELRHACFARVRAKVVPFMNVLDDDILAKETTFLCRAASVLIALTEALQENSPGLARKISTDAPALDRKLWVVMQKLCDMSDYRIRFDTTLTRDIWLQWAEEVKFLGGKDDRFLTRDESEMDSSIFEWQDLRLLQATCPISADRALEGRQSPRDVLASGALSRELDMSGRLSRYTVTTPIVTRHYETCINQMFPGDEVKPPRPTTLEVPAAPPPCTTNQAQNMRVYIYKYVAGKYFVGNLASMNAIAMVFLRELRLALIRHDHGRFSHLIDLHRTWEEEGLLDIKADDLDHDMIFQHIEDGQHGEPSSSAFQYQTPTQMKAARAKIVDADEEDEGSQEKSKPALKRGILYTPAEDTSVIQRPYKKGYLATPHLLEKMAEKYDVQFANDNFSGSISD